MNHSLRGCLLVAAVTIASLLLPATAAFAATDDSEDTITWMVRPSDGVGEDGRSWVEQELDPGQVAEEHLLIRNLSPGDVTFVLTAADAYFTDTGRFNMLASDQESVDAGTWIAIQETVDVASGAEVIVPFTIAVPDNATPGDHPAGVAASIRSGGDAEVGIESRVGFRVMTRVTGELAPGVAAAIAGSYVGSWNPFDPGRLDVEYSIANTGNTRVTVTPQISATALFGLVSVTVAGAEIVEIAPGESREATVSLRQLWPLFLYTAEVDARVSDALVGGGDVSAHSTATVAAMPWSQLAALALALLIFWWLLRDHRRRQLNLQSLIEEARRDGRSQAERSVLKRVGTAAGTALALTAALAVLTAVPAAASAQPQPDDPSSVTIHVDIEPASGPTATPSPSTQGDDLPATGASDTSPLAIGGLIAATVGIVIVLAHRRGVRRDTGV